MEKRQTRDQQVLAMVERLTQVIREARFIQEQDTAAEFHPQSIRYAHLDALIQSERRLIEEISLPCRLLIEHFSAFLNQPDRHIGVRYGLSLFHNGAYHGFEINEWGHVAIKLGNFTITWRDDEYQYMFYADKIVLRAYDIQKPEISFSFNFPVKYSKLLEEFPDVMTHPQTGYYQADLFERDV